MTRFTRLLIDESDDNPRLSGDFFFLWLNDYNLAIVMSGYELSKYLKNSYT